MHKYSCRQKKGSLSISTRPGISHWTTGTGKSRPMRYNRTLQDWFVIIKKEVQIMLKKAHFRCSESPTIALFTIITITGSNWFLRAAFARLKSILRDEFNKRQVLKHFRFVIIIYKMVPLITETSCFMM